VTADTQGNQIQFTVSSQLSARLQMVDLKLFAPATILATPTIAFKYLLTQ
jgi:hypothetical protein